MNVSRRKKSIIQAVSILSITTLLFGCSNPNEGADNKSNQDTLTMAWPRDIGEMNPHVYNPSQLFAQSMVYEPLVHYAEGGKLEPFLAKSWDISKDGKTYTFKLRDDVKFSDGSTFDATIVKKNFDAVLKNKALHSWLGFISKIDKTEAVDKQTFRMTLSEAYYPTIQELAVVRPVRFLGEAGFPKNGDTSKGVEQEVGTGPWVLDEYKADQYATFKVNKNYWGPMPKVKKIKVDIIPDAESRVLAFEKGDIDLIFGEGAISVDAYNQLKETKSYKTTMSEPVATRLLIMNTKKKQLADERVRQALQYGFDKKTLVEGITSGLEAPADFILPPNLPYTSNLNVEKRDFDVAKAKSLLDEAGWKLPNGKKIREKDGQPLQIEMMYDAAELVQKAMAETLQSEWASIGVDLKIVGVELPDQVQRFKDNKFDINMYSNFGAPYDPHTFVNIIGTDGFGFKEAISAYPNKDQLLQEMKDVLKTTDETKRQKMYAEILPSLQDQGALVPISYLKKMAIYQNGVTNFKFAANRDESPFAQIGIK
ncbi:nickel ABC transporter, periplasmic nickel-binding protein [Exiguobacterium sibiricum 255-15]|uniref:Nickel ABC transporter, periplasmic nickel-binding protein n=1 Tax=Exiguobacterium sibiricum (strain DSM 17290 / CCUG 55495 / CIP 109462 / JCM 13490 / 255-15) TaxID=262543 RepID=B1YFE0_EXIS2|nr:nickel ABC transporter substrate-binding protein [Exiguobacterium sibiricum]ACB60816.1 nickel ABC transporter, periplasmic nickel-binding protein [Exiguobacterium sibiricum 255-15]